MKKNTLFFAFASLVLLVTGAFTSCKQDDNNKITVIDPSTIATDSLIAYFPFDGSGDDKIASLTPSNTNAHVTYVTGKRGQCYQGDSLAYLLYNLSNFDKLAFLTKGITISCWLKPTTVFGNSIPNIVEICCSDDLSSGDFKFFQGALNQGADSCYFRCQFSTYGGIVTADNKTSKKFMATKWAYYTLVYDGTNSLLKYYMNGNYIPEMTTNCLNAGLLKFINVNKLVLGGWLQKITGTSTATQYGWFKGNMDELRIYKAPLSDAQIKRLYDAEVSELN